MKNLLLALALTISLSSNASKPAPIQEYIEIKYVGVQNYTPKPLFISVQKLELPNRIKKELIGYFPTQKRWGKIDTVIALKYSCHFVLTDKITYAKVSRFINSHKKYFEVHSPKKRGPYYSSYVITIHNTSYTVVEKFAYRYIRELINYLMDNNCDKNVIEEVKTLSANTLDKRIH